MALILGSNCFFLWFSLPFWGDQGEYLWYSLNLGALVHSFGPGFRIQGLFSSSRFGDKVSLTLALVPFSGCVSFPGSEPRAKLLRDCARATNLLNLWCLGLSKEIKDFLKFNENTAQHTQTSGTQ